MLAQAGGLALISPLYLLLYISTSPTVFAPSPTNLAVDSATLSGIPVAWLLGFGIPTALLVLPAPAVLSIATKVKALVLWQPFPLYMTLVLCMWRAISSSPGARTSQLDQLKRLRNVYKFGLAIAAPVHAAIWGVSLAAVLFPQLFAPGIAADFHPLSALIPPNPVTFVASVPSMARGAQNFLQWDYFVSSSAYLVFALSARFNSKVEPKGFSAGNLLGLAVRTFTLGPMGTALSYLWERDEIVLGKEEGQKKLR